MSVPRVRVPCDRSVPHVVHTHTSTIREVTTHTQHAHKPTRAPNAKSKSHSTYTYQQCTFSALGCVDRRSQDKAVSVALVKSMLRRMKIASGRASAQHSLGQCPTSGSSTA
eukprot:1232146-Rhodomonas_salina.1